MRSFREIKLHYNFTAEDEKRLDSLKNLMAENVDKAMDALHSWILQTKQAAAFFTEERRRTHIFGAQKKWFLNLFGGTYDNTYYEGLIRIGQTHVKKLVDAHFMNRAVNIIRNFCVNVINNQIEDVDERASRNRTSQGRKVSYQRFYRSRACYYHKRDNDCYT
jgi:hypothetical protein